jgi:hypothetical protein
MPRTFTAAGRRNLLATSADAPFLVLLQIVHPDLAVPVCVVNDTQNVTSQGVEYLACAFDVTLPDDTDGQIPQAQLVVDNIGRELTQWLEVSGGGQGARCRLMQILRSDPDTLEFDMTLDLTNLHIDNQKVTGDIGFQNTLALASTVPTFTPSAAPGLW